MNLCELYADLLRTRIQRNALAFAEALRASRPLEAQLLDRFVREGTALRRLMRVAGAAALHGSDRSCPKSRKPARSGSVNMVMISVAREPPGADWHPEAI